MARAVTAAVAPAPCARCPFRSDVPVFLREDRRREIVDALLADRSFNCHVHVVWTEDDDGAAFVESTGPECAGAVKALALAGGAGQMTRIAERLGLVDVARQAEVGAPVWDLSVWPLVPMGETAETWDVVDADEVETCVDSGDGCLAPAGYLGGGGAVVHGTEAADGECSLCGEPLCSACADEAGRCLSCTDEDDEW